jgi:hypothetical protein
MRAKPGGGDALAVARPAAVVLRRCLLLTGAAFGFWLLSMLVGAGHASASPAAPPTPAPVPAAATHAPLTTRALAAIGDTARLRPHPAQRAANATGHVGASTASTLHRAAAAATTSVPRAARAVAAATKPVDTAVHAVVTTAGRVTRTAPSPGEGGLVPPVLPLPSVGVGVPHASGDGSERDPVLRPAARTAPLSHVLIALRHPAPSSEASEQPQPHARPAATHAPTPAAGDDHQAGLRHHQQPVPVGSGDGGETPSTGGSASSGLSAAELPRSPSLRLRSSSSLLDAVTAAARAATVPEPSFSPD